MHLSTPEIVLLTPRPRYRELWRPLIYKIQSSEGRILHFEIMNLFNDLHLLKISDLKLNFVVDNLFYYLRVLYFASNFSLFLLVFFLIFSHRHASWFPGGLRWAINITWKRMACYLILPKHGILYSLRPFLTLFKILCILNYIYF